MGGQQRSRIVRKECTRAVSELDNVKPRAGRSVSRLLRFLFLLSDQGLLVESAGQAFQRLKRCLFFLQICCELRRSL